MVIDYMLENNDKPEKTIIISISNRSPFFYKPVIKPRADLYAPS